MKVIERDFGYDSIYIIPIGDTHIGDKSFGVEARRKLDGYLDWVKEHKNAFIFLMGDIINCASTSSESSPFQQDMDLKEQVDYAIKIFRPLRKKILGAISGNHEQRMEASWGYNPMVPICHALEIPYCGYSAVVKTRLGTVKKHRNKHKPEYYQSYIGYYHHTMGGGGTVGGKINRVDKLRQIVSNCDYYCGAHNHLLGVVHTSIFSFCQRTNKVKQKKQLLIDTGGYLEYDESYAEAKMLVPVKIGSPRIRLDGRQANRDMRCSV